MKWKALVFVGLLCAVLAFPARAALSFYFDTHLCLDPIGLVNDDQRVKRVVSSFIDLDGSKVRYFDDPECCRTVEEKITPEYAIKFRTVLFGRQAEFVEVKMGDPEIGSFYLRSDICGYYVQSV